MKEEDSHFYIACGPYGVVCTKQWNVLERVKMKLIEKMRYPPSPRQEPETPWHLLDLLDLLDLYLKRSEE